MADSGADGASSSGEIIMTVTKGELSGVLAKAELLAYGHRLHVMQEPKIQQREKTTMCVSGERLL